MSRTPEGVKSGATVPIIKYRTGGWNQPIERVECTRETMACVYFMVAPLFGNGKPVERRTQKYSGHERYHATWEDARTHLIAERESQIEAAVGAIKEAGEIIEKKRAEINVLKAATDPDCRNP